MLVFAVICGGVFLPHTEKRFARSTVKTLLRKCAVFSGKSFEIDASGIIKILPMRRRDRFLGLVCVSLDAAYILRCD